MADTEDGNYWKKPKGVFKAINAFEKKYPDVSKGKHSTPRLRKLGHVAKATTILSQATRERKESDDFKIINEFDPKVSNERLSTPRLRKVGHVAKAATILSGSTGEKKESRFNKNTRENRKSLVSSASSNGSHRGILKNNKITRTLSNTVKFKEENEINSTQNGPKESVSRRKLSSSGSPSNRTNRKSWEEGYHADCLSPVIKTRNVNKARNKHGKIVGRKSSAMKTRKNGKDKEGSKDSTDHLNESDSKEGEKEEILSLARENLAIQKNKAQALWRRLRTMVKLTRKMRFYSQPSLVLVSSHNKTSSAWNKLRSVIVATKMANKLLRIRREESGQIPRGGGRRQEGSFDTLGK